MAYIYILIILILINISFCKRRIYNVTEYEFDDKAQETRNTKIKWLMMIYTEQYEEFGKFMALLKEDIYPNYKKNKTIKFGLMEMNPNNFQWIINMFEIKGLPCIFLVSNGSIYYFRKNEVSQENIIQFIDEEKSLNDSSPIPPKLNYFIKGIIKFKILVYDINDIFQGLLDKFKIKKFKWNSIYTLIILVIFMYLFIKFLMYMIKLCCTRDKSKNKNENKEIEEDNNNENKEKNENLKEIKKEKTE